MSSFATDSAKWLVAIKKLSAAVARVGVEQLLLRAHLATNCRGAAVICTAYSARLGSLGISAAADEAAASDAPIFTTRGTCGATSVPIFAGVDVQRGRELPRRWRGAAVLAWSRRWRAAGRTRAGAEDARRVERRHHLALAFVGVARQLGDEVHRRARRRRRSACAASGARAPARADAHDAAARHADHRLAARRRRRAFRARLRRCCCCCRRSKRPPACAAR